MDHLFAVYGHESFGGVQTDLVKFNERNVRFHRDEVSETAGAELEKDVHLFKLLPE